MYIGPGETTEHEGDDGSRNRTVAEVKDFQNQDGDTRCRNRRPTAAFRKQHLQVIVQKTGRTCGTFKASDCHVHGEKQTGYFKARARQNVGWNREPRNRRNEERI